MQQMQQMLMAPMNAAMGNNAPMMIPQIPHHMMPQMMAAAQQAAAASTAQPKMRRGKKGKDGKMKRPRSKKNPDAPRRPKSAYMFFLGEFRKDWKLANPDSKKVSEVAKAAGDKWRAMSEMEKAHYEKQSMDAKDAYKAQMVEYDKDHPKPLRRAKKERDPAELKRPQSAYFFFLADFREEYKAAHPGEPTAVSVIGKAAGARWKEMTPEQKLPYENMSTASKAEYARLKTLTPAERVMVAAAARMQQPDGTPMTTDPHALLAAQAQHGFAGQVMM